MKIISKAFTITGATMLVLLVVGGLANSYGAGIPINYITNLSLFVFPIVLLFSWILK